MTTGELVVESLVKRYSTVTAVDGVSFGVEPGELVTLLGPSGSGKTTTLMMIAGFVPPTAGKVFLRGENITYMPAHLRNVGMVFQNYALFPHMNVFANVGFPLAMRGIKGAERRKRVHAALELVHMMGYDDRMPNELSGGQQQRVALARALVFQPSLLLMDEPLGALDRSLRERIQSEIKAIQAATGVAIVYVTHDQQEALVLSDRIVVMDRGAVRMQGSAMEVYERPCDAFVAQFIGETNLLRGRLLMTGGGTTVSLAPGIEVPAPSLAGSAGPDVYLCIRPERIVCSTRNPAEGASRFAACVTEVTYLGDAIRFRVTLESAPEVAVVLKRLVADGSAPVRRGDRVTVGWSAEDSWLLPIS